MSYHCAICRVDITEAEFKYSKDKYDKALCRKHQKNAKYVDNTSNDKKATNESNRLFVPLTQLGWKVKSESYDGYKHVDLSIPAAKVDIEVDGQHHNYNSKQALADVKRTLHSYIDGYITLRIPNSLVNDQVRLEETSGYLNEMLKERVNRLEKEEKNKKIATLVKAAFIIYFAYTLLNYGGIL